MNYIDHLILKTVIYSVSYSHMFIIIKCLAFKISCIIFLLESDNTDNHFIFNGLIFGESIDPTTTDKFLCIIGKYPLL